MLFLISYKFSDAAAQEKGAKMLTEWYDKGGQQNRPENYDVKSWIFLPQHGNGYSVVDTDSLETIWRQWRPWRDLMEITIEPCADLDEAVALFNTFNAGTIVDGGPPLPFWIVLIVNPFLCIYGLINSKK